MTFQIVLCWYVVRARFSHDQFSLPYSKSVGNGKGNKA